MFRPLLIPIAMCTIFPVAHAQARTEQEALKNRTRPYFEGKAALEQLSASTLWDPKLVITVEAKTEEIKKMLVDFHKLQGLLPEFREYANTANDQYVDLSFSYAEIAMRRKEYEAAENCYRGIISFLVGSSYAGIRERAKLGIDDIREAKRLQAAKTVESNAPALVTVPRFDLEAELSKLYRMKREKLISDAEFKELRKLALEKAKTK